MAIELNATTAVPAGVRAALGLPFPVKVYGAVGDGSTDDTAEIQAAIDAAEAAGGGRVLLMPGKTHRISADLIIDSPNVTLDGAGATINRDAQVSSGDNVIEVSASNVTINDLTIRCATAAAEINGAYGILVFGSATDVLISGVQVHTIAATGIVIAGAASRVNVTDCYVHDTQADGIRFAGTVTHCAATGCHVASTGDDGISIVGAIAEGVRPTGITIDGNTVEDTTDGRGITCVGGQSVVISNNVVRNVDLAGILVAHDGTFSTYGARNVVVDGNVVENANTDAGSHAGIMVASGDSTSDTQVRNVRVSNNIVFSGVGGIRATGSSADNILNLSINDNTIYDITGSLSTGAGIRTSGVKNLTVDNNRLDAIDAYGIYILSSCTGLISIRQNALTDINRDADAAVDGIHVESATSATAIRILDNHVAGTSLDNEVECAAANTIIRLVQDLPATYVALTGDQTVAGVKTFSSDPLIPDEAYGSGWNGVLEPATKNAVWDALQNFITQPIFLTADMLLPVAGSPARSNSGGAGTSDRTAVYLLDPTTEEWVGASIIAPRGWATADVYVWWTVSSTTTGDVVWQLVHCSAADGEQWDAETTETAVTAAVPTVSQKAKATLLKSGLAVTPGEVLRFSILRDADAAGDTLTIDAGLVGVEFRWAS